MHLFVIVVVRRQQIRTSTVVDSAAVARRSRNATFVGRIIDGRTVLDHQMIGRDGHLRT
jgi:hypothetical protein